MVAYAYGESMWASLSTLPALAVDAYPLPVLHSNWYGRTRFVSRRHNVSVDSSFLFICEEIVQYLLVYRRFDTKQYLSPYKISKVSVGRLKEII